MIKPGYTRISTLISPFHNFAHVDEEIIKKKAELGTFVHSKIESYLMKTDKLSEIEDINSYLQAFAMFIREKNIDHNNILAIEKRYYNDIFMITGKIDCIMKYGDKTLLLDWKTTVRFYELASSIQLCLYWYLAMGEFDIDDLFIVRLDRGFYELHKICKNSYFGKAMDVLEDHIT